MRIASDRSQAAKGLEMRMKARGFRFSQKRAEAVISILHEAFLATRNSYRYCPNCGESLAIDRIGQLFKNKDKKEVIKNEN